MDVVSIIFKPAIGTLTTVFSARVLKMVQYCTYSMTKDGFFIVP